MTKRLHTLALFPTLLLSASTLAFSYNFENGFHSLNDVYKLVIQLQSPDSKQRGETKAGLSSPHYTQCNKILIATDIDNTIIHIEQDRYKPYRESETVLPKLSQIPGVTLLGLTSRPGLALSPEVLEARMTASTPISIEKVRLARTTWERIKHNHDDHDNLFPFWKSVPANTSYPFPHVEFLIDFSAGGPIGSFLGADMKSSFNFGSDGEIREIFNFPIHSKPYEYFILKNNSELTPLPSREIPLKAKNSYHVLIETEKFDDIGNLISFWNGILLVSEQNKGIALREFLHSRLRVHPEDKRYNFDCIVALDDQEQNLHEIEAAFTSESISRNIHLIHFNKIWVGPQK